VRSRQQTLREITAAVAVGRVAEIESGKVQQVETHQHRWAGALCGGDFRGAVELCAVLQGIEGWPAVWAEGHDFSVEDHLAGRVRGELRRDLRKTTGQVEAAARLQPHGAGVDEGDDPVSIELRFVAPLRIRVRTVTALGEHRGETQGELFRRTA